MHLDVAVLVCVMDDAKAQDMKTSHGGTARRFMIFEDFVKLVSPPVMPLLLSFFFFFHGF